MVLKYFSQDGCALPQVLHSTDSVPKNMYCFLNPVSVSDIIGVQGNTVSAGWYYWYWNWYGYSLW